VAIEYEASQKTKKRYRKIFLNYELDRKIHEVLYIVDSKELVQTLIDEASKYSKVRFTTMAELKKDALNTRITNSKGTTSLYEVLEVV
jgi:hypothetical protein